MKFSLPTLLGVLFIALKLTGYTAVATWSWLWVLAPFWIGYAIAFTFMGLAVLVGLLVATGTGRNR